MCAARSPASPATFNSQKPGAGLSIRDHVPEKDGLLAGLLCCEAVACRGKSLGEQFRSISNQVGSFYAQRENFRLTPEVKTKFTEQLKSDPHEFSTTTSGKSCAETE